MYHPDIPPQCPPHDALPANQLIFRQINEVPISSDHFLSHIENGKSTKVANCEHWGCSVWVDEEGVDHALDIFPHFRVTYIISGNVLPIQGCIKHTPNNRQERHYTFWKTYGVDVTPAFSVFRNPDAEEEE
jgi:hypothetical protein